MTDVGQQAGKIHFVNGDARRLPLEDGSVQCCITSPPYWGLRDYGIPPTVWGGDDACDHEWGEWRENHSQRETTASGKTRTTDRCYGDASRKFDGNHQKHAAGQFCSRCDAWRGCLGLEPTPDLFVSHIVEVFREVRRVLRPDGTLWLNLGDSYNAYNGGAGPSSSISAGAQTRERPALASGFGLRCKGLKPKDLCGIPWRAALALQADGWWLRDVIIWHKPNPMPSSVTDRTTTSHEYVFLLTKSARYYYDADAIREPVTSSGGAGFGKQNFDAGGSGAQSRKLEDPAERNHPLGRNKRSVWTISTESCREAHFATFPRKLVRPMVLAGTSEKGCCSRCGAPWKRVVEKVTLPPVAEYEGKWAGTDKQSSGRRILLRTKAGRAAGLPHDNPIPPRVTTHWLPSCKCDAGEAVPCTVLDVFNGAGTTGLVCLEGGRRYVGIERKPEYIQISRARLEAYREKLAELSKPKRRRAVRTSRPTNDYSLFMELA